VKSGRTRTADRETFDQLIFASCNTLNAPADYPTVASAVAVPSEYPSRPIS
jgi:hypothetical protein